MQGRASATLLLVHTVYRAETKERTDVAQWTGHIVLTGVPLVIVEICFVLLSELPPPPMSVENTSL